MLGISACFFLPFGNQVPGRRYFLYQQNGFWRRKEWNAVLRSEEKKITKKVMKEPWGAENYK